MWGSVRVRAGPWPMVWVDFPRRHTHGGTQWHAGERQPLEVKHASIDAAEVGGHARLAELQLGHARHGAADAVPDARYGDEGAAAPSRGRCRRRRSPGWWAESLNASSATQSASRAAVRSAKNAATAPANSLSKLE